MVVSCEKCGLKYKIDPAKIKGEQARLKCKGCENIITLNKQSLLDEALLSKKDDNQSTLSLGKAAGKKQNKSNDVSSGKDVPQPEAHDQFQKRSGFGLTTKIVLLMLLVSVVPGVVYFGLSFKQSCDHLIKETTITGDKMSGLLAVEVDEWIDKNTRMLKTLSQLPGMQSMDRYKQEVLLKIVQKQYPWVHLAFTMDIKGLNTARSDGKGLKDYSNRQYVKDITDQGKEIAGLAFIDKTSQNPVLVLAVPIKKNSTIVGVLACEMTREYISNLVTNSMQGTTGNTILVDEFGKVVAHKNSEFVTSQKDMGNHPLIQTAQSVESQMVEFLGDGDQKFIGFAKKTKLGWTLAMQQPKDNVFAHLHKVLIIAYSVLGGTVACVLIIALLGSRAIVTPIRKLTDAANRISVGELGVEIDITSTDEVGDLASAIIRMQDSIRLSISRLKRYRKQ